MHAYKIDEASKKLGDLVRQAARGESVVITAEDGTKVELVVVGGVRHRRGFGSSQGKISMKPDFDEPIPGFEPDME